MLWLLWFLGCMRLTFQWLVGGPVGPRLFHGEAIAASIAVGTVGSTWIVYLVSCALNSLSLTGVAISTAIMYYFVRGRSDAYRREYAAMRERGVRRDDLLALGVVLLLSLVLYPTYSARMIPERDGKIWAGGSCYGDLPIHMTIAESFLTGCNQRVGWGPRMQSPIFSGHPMTYPFLPDFHAAILVRLGGSMRDGFLLPGFLMACSLWALLYYFTLRVTRSRLGGVLSVFLVLCAGGLGGWRWIESEYNGGAGGRTLEGAFYSALGKDVVQHDPTGEWKYLWFAFVPHIMLPQRGANFAYPVAIFVLELVWMATDSGTRLHQGHRRTMLVLAAALAACLPMVQAHSFIGLGIIIAVVALLDFHKYLADAHLLASWAIAGVTALVIAYPQMSQFTTTVSQGFYGKFLQYGWLFRNYEFGEPHTEPLGGLPGLLRFWFFNLGPALPLFLFAMALALVEVYAARRLARKLCTASDDGPGGMARYLASLAASSEVIGEPNPLPPAPKSALGSERPLPATVPAWSHALGLDRLDATFAPLNALSPTGRAWDTFKLALGGLGVFVVSNYVNFQPWDRDNAKIYYVFLFVAAPLNAGLIAAPIEYFAARWSAAPGRDRIPRWFGALTTTSYASEAAVGGGGGGGGNGPSSSSSSARKAATSAALGRGGDDDDGGAAKGRRAAGGDGSGSVSRFGDAVGARRAGAGGVAEVVFAHLFRLASVPLFLLMTLSGFMMLLQEYYDGQGGGGVLLDDDAIRMAAWIRGHTSPGSVVLHSNYHVQPSGALAGRPSLVAYYGWVSNHGYNANERLGDRDYVLDNALKGSDPRAVELLRKWGVKYVLGEGMRRHARTPEEARDPALFLDGNLRHAHTDGRYELYEVLPPRSA